MFCDCLQRSLAVADLLNANIIARDLGLREKLEATGKDGKDLIPEKRDDL